MLAVGFLILGQLTEINNRAKEADKHKCDERELCEADLEYIRRETEKKKKSEAKVKEIGAWLKAKKTKAVAKTKARKAYWAKVKKKGFWKYASGR
jgi:hypothetical protein